MDVVRKKMNEDVLLFFFHRCAFCRADTGVCNVRVHVSVHALLYVRLGTGTMATVSPLTAGCVRSSWISVHMSPLNTLIIHSQGLLKHGILHPTGLEDRCCRACERVCVFVCGLCVCVCVCFPEWYSSHVLVARDSVHFAEESNKAPVTQTLPRQDLHRTGGTLGA